MKKVYILLAIILIALVSVTKSSNLQQVSPLTPTDTSLGFYNKNGSCFGQSQLSTLISLLNKASTIYRSDFKENLRYIQENMDAAFGTQNERYNIFIQSNTQGSKGDYHVNSIGEDGCNFVSIFSRINLINPDWSYLAVKNYYKYTPAFVYVYNVSQGSGITTQLRTKIYQFIADIQKRSYECICFGLTNITDNLKAIDGQDWSIVCQRQTSTYGYFAPKNNQWIFTQRECSYLLYVQ